MLWLFRCSYSDHIFPATPDPTAPKTEEEVPAWLEMSEVETWQRATQVMRGRPVTYAEACKAAQRLINRAHNCDGEKSTMSIPVQASDDDVLLFDYLTENHQQAQQVAALKAALESLFKNGGIGVDAGGHIFLVDEDALVNELVNTAAALAAISGKKTTHE